MKMELNNINSKLQALIDKAWALQDSLNREIEHCISFCRFCSDHGRYCDVGLTPFYYDKERLIAIRDSLQQVEHSLLHLQKLQSWQQIDRHSAFTSLEQSRLFLIKQATEYKGRPLDVVKELKLCFGNEGKPEFDMKMDVNETGNKNIEVQSRRRRVSSFLICCIRFLFNPWKWHNAVGIAVKLLLISVSLSSTIQFYHAKQLQSFNSKRKFVSNNAIMYPKETEQLDSLLSISKIPLDVFCGRG